MRDFRIEKDFVLDGYRCVIVAQYLGHRCGYIGLSKEHPLYGKDYEYFDYLDIQVHGGWTYSDDGENTKYPIESDLWWVGFDCAHLGDDKDLDLIKSFGNTEIAKHLLEMEAMYPLGGKVRTTEYVEQELKEAVEQIKRLL